MKNDIIKGLISVANSLDSKGFGKEADQLDRIMRKIAQVDPTLLQEMLVEQEVQGMNFEAGDLTGQFNLSLEEAEVYADALRMKDSPDIIADKIKEDQEAEGQTFTREKIKSKYDLSEEILDQVFSILYPSVLPKPEETAGCTPNGKPLLRIPGDRTYGYQLTDNNMGYQAWKLDGCEPVLGGREFKYTEGGSDRMLKSVNKVREVAGLEPIATAVASEGPEVTEEIIEEIEVNPNADAIAELESLRGRVKDAEDTRRFEQNGPTVQEAQKLLGIKNITPLAPGVRKKYLLKLIDKGIAKLEGDSADDASMSAEASKAEQRISKFASLLSGEFGGLDKKIRR